MYFFKASLDGLCHCSSKTAVLLSYCPHIFNSENVTPVFTFLLLNQILSVKEEKKSSAEEESKEGVSSTEKEQFVFGQNMNARVTVSICGWLQNGDYCVGIFWQEGVEGEVGVGEGGDV